MVKKKIMIKGKKVKDVGYRLGLSKKQMNWEYLI